MENYKYSLDKSSKKFACPNCHKRTFVRYVDTDTNSYLSEVFGRCDRESKCQYHNAPAKEIIGIKVNLKTIQSISEKAYKALDQNGNDYIIPKSQVLDISNGQAWLSDWYVSKNNIPNFSDTKIFTPNSYVVNTVKTIQKEPDLPSYHSLELVDLHYNEKPVKDNFKSYLESIFSEVEVYKAMQNYFLTGTNYYWNSSTVFWQIDQKERVRGGKIMLYNASTGKRVKQPYNCINWMHNAVKRSEFNLNQCLFGLHRIIENPEQAIAIVESEKTALIMSIVIPNVIWLATGSKQNLKIKMLEPLRNNEIVLYPDKGEFELWSKKAQTFRELGYKVAVSSFLEPTDLKEGEDLADYYLSTKKIANNTEIVQ